MISGSVQVQFTIVYIVYAIDIFPYILDRLYLYILTYVKVQSHYSVCIAYANFRKRMHISEKKLLYAKHLTPHLDYKPLQTYE